MSCHIAQVHGAQAMGGTHLIKESGNPITPYYMFGVEISAMDAPPRRNRASFDGAALEARSRAVRRLSVDSVCFPARYVLPEVAVSE